MALAVNEVLAKIDTNGPPSVGIALISDAGLNSSDRLPVGHDAAPVDQDYAHIVQSVLLHFDSSIDPSVAVPEQP